ncbi:MAG TPA: hypothetical protein VFP38_21470 [Bradyrhizobium sp.]|nr:hypothetical protein [Bradyrhizobium sp.]
MAEFGLDEISAFSWVRPLHIEIVASVPSLCAALRPTGGRLSLAGFFKATLAGGLLFLLPVVLIVIVLRHAIQLAEKVTKPISSLLPIETVLGIRGETCLAVLLLILISLGAGLVARTNFGKRIMSWFENSFLGGLPQYQLMKSMAEGLAHVESAENVKPVLVSIEDGWQMGYFQAGLPAIR